MRNESNFHRKSRTRDFIQHIKGIVSDSNNNFLLQQLEDNDEKRLFPKFQFIPIFRLQVMHDYVHWYCSIDYCVK